MNDDMDKTKSQPKSGNREREHSGKERVHDDTDPNVKNPVTSAHKADAPGMKSPSTGNQRSSNQGGANRQVGSNQDGNKPAKPGSMGTLGHGEGDGGSRASEGQKPRQGDEKTGTQNQKNPGKKNPSKPNAADECDDEDGVGA